MSITIWRDPETDEYVLEDTDREKDLSKIWEALDSDHEVLESHQRSLLIIDEVLESHEKALLIVADTENKAADCINYCLWLSVLSFLISIAAMYCAVM